MAVVVGEGSDGLESRSNVVFDCQISDLAFVPDPSGINVDVESQSLLDVEEGSVEMNADMHIRRPDVGW